MSFMRIMWYHWYGSCQQTTFADRVAGNSTILWLSCGTVCPDDRLIKHSCAEREIQDLRIAHISPCNSVALTQKSTIAWSQASTQQSNEQQQQQQPQIVFVQRKLELASFEYLPTSTAQILLMQLVRHRLYASSPMALLTCRSLINASRVWMSHWLR